jgi:hypothetical protein
MAFCFRGSRLADLLNLKGKTARGIRMSRECRQVLSRLRESEVMRLRRPCNDQLFPSLLCLGIADDRELAL